MSIPGSIGSMCRRAAWIGPLLMTVGCGSASTATVSPPSESGSPTPSYPPGSPVPVGTVTLEGDGCTFDGPSDLDAGSVRLVMVNESAGRFDADLWRLHDGHGYDEFAALIAEEMRRAEAGEGSLGHPTFASLVAESSASAGSEAVLDVGLTSGTHAIACILFISSSDVGGIWAVGPLEVR